MSVAIIFIHDTSGCMNKKNTEAAKQILNDVFKDYSERKSLKFIYIPFNNVVDKVEVLEFDFFLNNSNFDGFQGLCNINVALKECEKQIKLNFDEFDKIMIFIATANSITCMPDVDGFNDSLQHYGGKVSTFICNYGRKYLYFNIPSANVLDDSGNPDEKALSLFNEKILTFINSK